jgi:alpha-L-fucosidase 2
VKARASDYKVDRRRIALIGESAGGHLVSFAGAKSKPDTRVDAVVSFYGPHNFVSRAKPGFNISSGLKGFLGFNSLDEAAWERMRLASPINYVTPGMPPYLLIHGTGDQLVPFQQSEEMCAKMNSKGASCEVFPVSGAPHGIGAWEKNPQFQAYKEKMVQWLKSTLPRK